MTIQNGQYGKIVYCLTRRAAPNLKRPQVMVDITHQNHRNAEFCDFWPNSLKAIGKFFFKVHIS